MWITSISICLRTQGECESRESNIRKRNIKNNTLFHLSHQFAIQITGIVFSVGEREREGERRKTKNDKIPQQFSRWILHKIELLCLRIELQSRFSAYKSTRNSVMLDVAQKKKKNSFPVMVVFNFIRVTFYVSILCFSTSR